MIGPFLRRWLTLPYTLHIQYYGQKKHPKATVLFIHGIGSSGMVWKDVISQLPADMQAVSVDLLGFGKSPRPKNQKYNAKIQARSVLATHYRHNLPGRLIIVGHSLGSLVAVEIARRYPLLVKGLVLVSPPFYDQTRSGRLPSADKLLTHIYSEAIKHPDRLFKLAELLIRHRLVNPTISLTPESFDSFRATLETTIINQTSMLDAGKLLVPTHIIRGAFDPLVVVRNLKKLVRQNKNIQLLTVPAGHDLNVRYTPAIINSIRKISEN